MGRRKSSPALDKAVALAAAIEAAKATVVADGDVRRYLPHGRPRWFTAMHDGMTVTVGVTEAGIPGGGDCPQRRLRRAGRRPPHPLPGGPAPGSSAARPAEHLAVYVDVGAPEAMAFTPGKTSTG